MSGANPAGPRPAGLPGSGIELEQLPLREDLRGRAPYGAPQLTNLIALNTNENPFPPPQQMCAEMATETQRVAGGMNRYPDREVTALRAALGEYLTSATGIGLGAANVWAANGSNEILQQLLQAFGGPGRSAMGFEPSYSMHPIISSATVTQWHPAPRRADFSFDAAAAAAAVTEHTPDIVFLTSPNNPTGQAMTLADIRTVVAAAPGLVIVDEAYAEFSGRPSAVTLLPEFADRLVISRTMSKAFAFAGGRLGYLAAAPAVVQALQLVRLPYHLSALTQAAALVALRWGASTLDGVATLIAERGRLTRELRQMGLRVVDSDANFLLFGPFADPDASWQRYVDRGVLIRQIELDGLLRVSIGTPEENTAFLTATAQIVKETAT